MCRQSVVYLCSKLVDNLVGAELIVSRNGRTAATGLRFGALDVELEEFHFAAAERAQVVVDVVADDVVDGDHCEDCRFADRAFRVVIGLRKRRECALTNAY